MSARRARSRSGMTLVEMLVGMVVAGIMLGALVGLFIGQSRLTDEQASQRAARNASRSAHQVLSSDLRRLEGSGGVESASADSVVLRVPFAMGLVCASSSGSTTISLLPADSATYAGAALSGFAWQDGDGDYAYVSETTRNNGAASTCSGASIATVSGGRVVEIDAGHSGIPAGAPAFLYQRIRYAFVDANAGASLIKTVLETGAEETLVEYFDGSTSRFRFFTAPSDPAENTPPADLGDLVGIELVIEGRGNRPRAMDGSVATARLVAPVFFKNATD